MRTKVTLVLLLLNVALLAVIIYARREWQAEREIARLSKRLLANEAIRLNSLEISVSGNDRKIRLERASETAPWELKSPINWPANDFAVRRIIHELEFLESETSFPVDGLEKSGRSLADYGLAPARLTLAFTRPAAKPGAPDIVTRLAVGDVTKVGNRLYVLSPDGRTVHVVGRSLAESLVVSLDDLRTDTLFTIPVFEVRSLGLQNAAPAPRVRLRRDGARWSFEAPIVTRAGKAPAEVAVAGLNRLRTQRFLADASSADTGLDKPDLRVTIEGNGRRETLLIGRPFPAAPSAPKESDSPSTAYYARMEDRPQVFVTAIPDGLIDTLRRAQETLRDTRVLDFDTASVTAITLIAPGQAEPLNLTRGDTTNWLIVRSGAAPAIPADTKLVETLLQRLSLLTATPHAPGESAFLRDAPSAAEVENYGFNLPQREITLSFASAPGGPAGGGPGKITLQLGVGGAEGGTVQARVTGQSFIYAVAPDTLNDLTVAALFYRERVLRTLPEGAQITGLSLVANDAPEKPLLSLRRPDGQSWADVLAAETAPRRAALTALLAGVATLRAKQFVNDGFTETTLVDGKPAPWKYTLEATLVLGGSAGAPQTGVTSLQIAERSGGGAQLAGSREFGVVFALEQPVLDALWTLTYGERDPGPPAVVAPDATPPAP